MKLYLVGCVLLFLVCCVGAAKHVCTLNDRPESLPETLDSLSYLGLEKEFHIHGEFFVNFTEGDFDMNFTITEESAFRMYIAPHDDWDVDLYLYNDSATPLDHSSLDFFTEEVLQNTLLPGSYRVRFMFYSASLFRPESTSSTVPECETLIMEASIVPKSRVVARASQHTCPEGKEEFPSLMPIVVKEDTGYAFADSHVYASNTTLPVGPLAKHKYIRMLRNYDFTLPTVKGTNGLWRVEVVLGSDFLVGGSLGVMLDLNGTTPETNLDCSNVLTPDDSLPSCRLGRRELMNQVILRWIVESDVMHTLWLYDIFGESDRTLSRCIPFTFSLKIEPIKPPENILSCDVPFIPATLNTADLLGERGFLHFKEDVFVDLPKGSHDIAFTLKEKSAFRVFTEEHRVDIDLRLKNGTGTGNVLASSLQFNRRETILIELDAGSYVLNIKYFGTYSVVFCETFLLEIGIIPLRFVPSTLCTGTSPDIKEVPDLSGLAANGATSFNVSFSKYRKSVDLHAPRQVLFFKEFTTTQTSQLRAIVGRDFVLGDLELAVQKTGSQKILAEHRRNVIIMNVELLPGSYNLTLTTGGLQTLPAPLPDLPSCVAYTFQMNWKLVDVRDSSCWDHISLPEAITTAFYLQPTELHLTDNYLVPAKGSGVLVSQFVEFTVPVRSQVRLYSEPHEVDIDFHVMQGAFNLASATAGANEEEELVAILEVGTTYRLLVQYFNSDMDPYRCSTFALEFAISPIPASPQCTAATLPAADFIPSPPRPVKAGDDLFISTGSYMFRGQDETFSRTWTFTLDESYYVRATVTYDFVWSNINARILLPGVGDEKPTEFALGELAYNRNELPLTQLPAGTYSLEIYEPLGTAGTTPATRCVPFSLTIAFASVRGNVSVAQSNVAYAGCPDLGLPSSLNTLSGISVFSNQTVHFKQRVVADIKAKREFVDFTLSVPSVVRVFVPHHETLDVDIILYRGTSSNPVTSLASGVGYNEESIIKNLTPGNYTVKFLYFGLNHLPLPNPLDCVTFHVEFGIVPLARLEAIPALASAACQDDLPPKYIQPSLPFAKTFKYKHVNNFVHNMTFATTTPGPFSVSLRYDFVSSALALELQGSIIINEGSIVRKSFYGQIGANHAFLEEVLRPGNYTLRLHDANGIVWDQSAITTLPCAPFELSYFLNTSGVIDGDYCDESETMPTDLHSSDGGSAGYGGPQKADGSIRLYGEKFLLPKQAGTHNYVEFKVPRDSFIRLYSVTPPKSDVDFYIYSNVNRTFNSLTNYSNAFDQKESSLFLLKRQSNNYLLDVSYFSIDSSKPCNYFLFMLEMKPVSRVYGDLACPAMLPVSLSNHLTLSTQNTLNIHGTYYFTKGQVDHNTANNKFRYRITLHVEDNTVFFADIAFDFLANDFHLTLSDANSVLHHGEMRAGEPGEEFSLHSTIDAPLTPGVYYLDINEDLMKTDLRLNTTQCHKYGIYLSSFSESTPRVLMVAPDSESAHSKDDDLIISIEMSESVAYPPASQLPILVTNNHWIFLKTEGSDRPRSVVRLSPDSVSYSNGNRVLTARWSSSVLVMGQTYELQFDLSNFTTAGGKHYANAVQQGHFYQVLSNTCNGHGHVNTSASGTVCICDPPYTGDDCLSCMNGYHGAGFTCVPDVSCTPNTCNGHGVCTDSDGYPECKCKAGYATVGDSFCSVCAEGYQGYPNCVSIPEPFDEGTRCKADLLPQSLDGMAYLGFDGEVRLQGHYFIDPLRREHSTLFTLKKDSVFRAILAPHWVDVDIALYKRSNNKEVLLTDGGYRMNTEESMFITLNKTTGDDQYVLKFRYYVFTTTTPDCETLNLALMISPLDRTIARAAANNGTCKATLNAPNGHLPDNKSPTIKSGEDYSYAVETLFATNGLNIPGGWAPDNFGTAPQGNFFWNMTFTVPAPPEDQVIVFNAAVGSSFLEDGIALLLERGNERKHCAKGSNATCITGISEYNRNVLDTILSPGTYTLWIFQPRAPFTDCSLFNFEFHVYFSYSWSDTFYCQGARFPASLNEPNYLDYNGVLHFQDDFLLEEIYQTVNFTIDTESFFKIAVTAELVLSFDLFLFSRNNTDTTLLTHSAAGLISTRLKKGSYEFDILVFDQLVGDECPAINMEIAITPVNLVNTQPESCIAGSPDVLPSLPSNLGSEPYQFNMSDIDGFKRFVTYKTGEIASYPIEVTEVMWLIVDIASDFLTADVRPEMHIDESNPTPARTIPTKKAIGNGRANQETNHRYGTHQYNLNQLDWFLTPGTYSLKITRPGTVGADSPLANCGVFNFGLKLLPLQEDYCEGEDVPTTLSSIRYLFSSNNINYQQSSYLIPKESRFPTRKISIAVQDKSLFRVYTEPHVVDIDLKLWRKNSTTGRYDILHAAAKNGFYDEELLAAVLERDESYSLELLFYKWNMNNVPACAVFSMGFAITQMANLPEPLPCRNGTDHWPPAFPANMPSKPYYYDSTDPTGTGSGGELLYFQQSVSEGARTKSYSFSLDDVTDLYMDVSYDFALGDLVLKLEDTISQETTYGTNEYNRNYLSLMNLVPSKYRLTIYEPPTEENVGLRKCSFFTFRAIIVKGGLSNLVDRTTPVMPTNLDRLPYLGYSKGLVHLQGSYSMFVPYSLETRTVGFTIDQPSAFRLAVLTEDKTSTVSVTLKKRSEESSLATGKNIYRSLAEGVYDLVFHYVSLVPQSEDTGDIYAVPLELAIKPARLLGDAVNAFVSNSTCVPLSKKLTTITINDNQPFYSLRGTYTINSADVEAANYVMGDVVMQLKKDTLIYAKLGFNFLFDAMFVHLTGRPFSDSSVFPSDGIKGAPSRNLNVLNQLVPAGNYSLSVALAPPISTVWVNKQFCMPYSFGLFLQEAKNEHEHFDCLEYDLLPWNLDTTAGGSVPFGGPIIGGSVHISGNRFLLMKKSTSTIVFTIREKSVLSLFFDQPTGSRAIVSFKVTNKPMNRMPDQLVSPAYTNTTYGQRLETFVLEPPQGSTSLIEIQLLKDVTVEPTGSCPYYSFDLLLQPVAQIKQDLICKAGHTVDIPAPTVTFDSKNVGVQRVQGVLDYATIKDGFQQKITFQIKDRPSALAVSASFNSLSNFLYITISKASRSFWVGTVGRSTFSVVTGRDETNIAQRIVGNLSPDNYTITLSRPNIRVAPYLPENGNCYPYIWELQLVPTNIPFVSFVFPEGGQGFNSFFDLVIRITLSEAPYTANGTVAITESNSQILAGAFKLMLDQLSIAPSSIELKSSDSTVWALTFSKASLKEGQTYRLNMISSVLYNSRSEPFIYTAKREFTTLAHGCSGHGVFNKATSKCECTGGYAGGNCELCAAGYVPTLPPPELGCIEDTTNVCSSNASICGCSNPGAAVCDPLGTCKVVGGKATCSCKPNYDGNNCESCATGYVNYPLCKLPDECNPHCVHGQCDKSTKTCTCDPNWAGSDCSTCAKGWTGSDCKTKQEDGGGSTSGFVKFLTILGILLAVFACFGGIAWVAWVQYKKHNWKKKINYFPLGLEELEDGLELQASSTFRDREEDSDEEEDSKKHKPAGDKGKPGLDLSDDDDELLPTAKPTRTRTTTSPTTPAVSVDNDFNPRARDTKKDAGDDDFNPRARDSKKDTSGGDISLLNL